MPQPIPIIIIVAALLVGFAAGYALRTYLSHRRRRIAKAKHLGEA